MVPGSASLEPVQWFAAALADLLVDNLVRVSLFGSRARGDAHLRSDYDLMVVLRRTDGDARSEVHRLATDFELERNIDLSTKIIDTKRFGALRQSSVPFWRRFRRDEKVLWPPTSSLSG